MPLRCNGRLPDHLLEFQCISSKRHFSFFSLPGFHRSGLSAWEMGSLLVLSSPVNHSILVTKKSPFHQDEDSRFHLILHIHCCIYLIGYHGYPCSVTGTPGFIYWTSINLAQKRTSLNFLYPLPPFGLALTFPSGTLFRHCLESVALNVTSRKLNVKKNMLPFHG